MEKKFSRALLLEELIELLHVLGRHIGPGREQFLCKAELNHAQLKFLYFVSTGNEITIPRLVELTNTTPGAVTQMVDGLIVSGFLQRSHNENDKRRVFVQFSTEGKKKFEKMKKMHIKFLQEVFEVLSDKELKQLVEIQKKIVINFTKKQ